MDRDESRLVLRRFNDRLHGATILTLQCGPVKPGATFGEDVVEQLRSEGLLGHVLWSTSCSVADVSAASFQWLSDAGLFLVRLDLAGADGVQGTASVRVNELLAAVQTLRRLNILVEYDLDLFGGGQRFAAVRTNLALLRAIVADGTTPATFRPVAPGTICSPWLETFERSLVAAVAPWLDDDGISAQLADAWAELVVAERLLLGLTGVAAHRIALQRLTLRSNRELLSLVGTSAADFEATGESAALQQDLLGPRCARLSESMLALRNSFLAANAPALEACKLRH